MSGRQQRPRGLQHYSKPALRHGELVERMRDRGLDVPNVERAERYLRYLGYYRLSPYTIPFQVGGPEHEFRDGATFDAVLDLYVFDRALRLLVMDALERVEVAIRSALTDHMSLKYEEPHWYVDPVHFRDSKRHGQLLDMVREACSAQLKRSAETDVDTLVHRSALEHYLTTYGSPDLPPSWLMVESLTLGQLSGLMGNLSSRSDRSVIAEALGLTDPVLRSWLRSYVRIRNICAHHGRLWNAGLGVYPALPQSPKISWLSRPQVLDDSPSRSKRLYPVLVSLQSVLNTVAPTSSWAARLSALLLEHPDVRLDAMGIPSDWRSDTFWARHL